MACCAVASQTRTPEWGISVSLVKENPGDLLQVSPHVVELGHAFPGRLEVGGAGRARPTNKLRSPLRLPRGRMLRNNRQTAPAPLVITSKE